MIWTMRKRSFSSDIFPMEDIWKWVCVWCSMKHLRAAKCTHSCIAPPSPPTHHHTKCMYSCIAPAPLSLLQHTIYHTALYHTTSYCATSHQVVSNQPTNPVLTQPAPNCTTWTELWILQCAVCHWVQCSIIRAQWYRTSSGSGRNPPPLPPTKPPPHHLHLLPSHHHHPLKHHHHHLHPPHPHLHLSQ